METKQIPITPRPIVGIRERVDDPGPFFESAIPELFAYADAHSISVVGPVLGVYYEVDDGMFDMAVALPVSDVADGDERVFSGSLSADRAIVTDYVGSYDGLPEAWSELMEIIGDDAPHLMPCWEEYRVGPEDDPNPLHWRTTLVQPIG